MKFFSKQIFLNVMISIFIGTALASNVDIYDDQTLIIGYHPSDDNHGIDNLGTPHFLTVELPDDSAFADLTKKQLYYYHNSDEAGCAINFDDFAVSNAGKFNLIVANWGTFYHFKDNNNCKNFSILLKQGGTFILPVEVFLNNGQIYSKQTARKFCENDLNRLFNNIKIRSHTQLPKDKRLVLLHHYANMHEDIMAFISKSKACVIFATK